MADTYGLVASPVPLPATPDEPITDPALKVILDFARAVMNADVGAAWAKVSPAPNKAQPVTAIFARNPERVGEPFNDSACPALYAYRKTGPGPHDLAVDFRVSQDTIVLIWVLESTQQDRQGLRSPAVNGMAKMLDRAIARGRHPAYAKPGDPDPLAATAPASADAIKLGIATSATSQTFTGAALDGAIGTGAVTPTRAVSVTLTGQASSFRTGSLITVVGTDVLGLPATAVLRVPSFPGAGSTPAGSDPAGTEPGAVSVTLSTGIDFSAVTEIDVDAQYGAAGTISVGLAARAGLGSLLVSALDSLEELTPLRAATPRAIVIPMADRSPARSYPGVEWQFQLTEQLHLDPAEYDPLEGTDLSIARADGSVIEQAFL